jgi:hypothetical protein
VLKKKNNNNQIVDKYNKLKETIERHGESIDPQNEKSTPVVETYI